MCFYIYFVHIKTKHYELQNVYEREGKNVFIINKKI